MLEVHVGDIGTKYRVRMLDNDKDFDPSDATTKELIFLMPGGIVLVKTAQVEEGTGEEAGRWFLYYIVAADAGAGDPPEDFHDAPGEVTIQAFCAGRTALDSIAIS